MKNLEFIYNRKSIRKFKDIQIPKEDILTLLDAATQAPSPKHQQNWHFVVLQNRDIINQMSDIVTESHTQIANLAPTKEQGEKYMRLLKYYTLFK
ncbi:nitroreductase family protein, partial [Turicibacter sanguinis]